MDVKQAIVIRRDLKMRRGKEIAQGAHASMLWLTERVLEPHGFFSKLVNFFYNLFNKNPSFSEEEMAWMNGSYAKITLQVNSEEELYTIFNNAKAALLNVYMVTDIGKTEFNGIPTKTALAIGPHESYKINTVTGHLELY